VTHRAAIGAVQVCASTRVGFPKDQVVVVWRHHRQGLSAEMVLGTPLTPPGRPVVGLLRPWNMTCCGGLASWSSFQDGGASCDDSGTRSCFQAESLCISAFRLASQTTPFAVGPRDVWDDTSKVIARRLTAETKLMQARPLSQPLGKCTIHICLLMTSYCLAVPWGNMGREGLPNCRCPGFVGEEWDRLAVPKTGPRTVEKTVLRAQLALASCRRVQWRRRLRKRMLPALVLEACCRTGDFCNHAFSPCLI
jgi:hypothetical protein